MRLRAYLVATPLLGLVTPATADTIQQTIGFYGDNAGGTINTVSGNLFDSSLGTLTSVNVEVKGTYDPNIFVYGATSLTPVSLDYKVTGFAPANIDSGSLAPFDLTQGSNGHLTGAPEPFDLSFAFPETDPFIESPPFSTGSLANIYLESHPISGMWAGGWDNESIYQGVLTVTYSYDVAVPEPASLTLLAFAATLLGLLTKAVPLRRRFFRTGLANN